MRVVIASFPFLLAAVCAAASVTPDAVCLAYEHVTQLRRFSELAPEVVSYVKKLLDDDAKRKADAAKKPTIITTKTKSIMVQLRDIQIRTSSCALACQDCGRSRVTFVKEV